MAVTYPIGPTRYLVTPADQGRFGVLGDVSEHEVGSWRVAFVPDASWQGSIAIMARASGKGPSDDGVAFGTTAYRRVQLGGIASDWALTQTGAPVPLVNTDFIIIVPASGLSVAIQVDWVAGFGVLYAQPLVGLSL